jgi:glutamate-ammonia-ligase adenylyltransferase
VLKIDQLPAFIEPTLERYWQALQERADSGAQPDAEALLELVQSQHGFSRQLAQVWACSDYAADVCLQHPDILLALHHSGQLLRLNMDDFYAELKAELHTLFPDQAGTDSTARLDEIELKTRLRLFQQKQMLRLIWRDVCHLASVRDTAAEVSVLAEVAMDVTLDLLHQWLVRTMGEPIGQRSGQPQRMVIVGMGKLGAGELNLSSDIDLMFAYPEIGETRHDNPEKTVSCQQFFIKLSQQLIDVLDTVTVDGFVFRVDMRLRPYGSEGVLACSFDAMENYYQLQGRDWERYAMIKARAVAGDIEAGEELLQRLRPFSYRRYLDFSAFESLRNMKQQINKQVRKKGMNEDVKLGAGGIREVEFIVQALQMVHGGRDKRLQQTSLYKAMDMIQAGDYLPADIVQALRNAYSFLRDLEHKLQALGNKQTQSLPESSDEQNRVAIAMAVPDLKNANWNDLILLLDAHRAIVRQHFSDVIHTEDDDDDASRHDVDDAQMQSLWHQDLTETQAIGLLVQLKFESPDRTWKQLSDFRKDRVYQTLPAESRQRFSRFMPLLLATLAVEKKPSMGFERVMKMVEAVARRTAYLVLLSENPHAMRQFVHLCTESPFIAEFLSRHPVLLDEMLGVMRQPPEKSALQEELTQGLLRIGEESFEEQMEYLRYFKQTHTLQVAAAQINGSMTVMKVSDYLTFTAEAILEQVLALSWQYLTRKHGYPVNNHGAHGRMDFVVIGYGKLGGIELSYLSDLDLVFLHDGALDENTVCVGGQKTINSREFYTRMAQRVITMLGTNTVSGKLYDVDMRLRPSGESGLLVSTLPAFEQYQTKDAWTWEHQALVRSRAVAGSTHMAGLFEQLRAHIISQPRDVQKLADDVMAMRRRMRGELTRKAGLKANQPGFAIKQASGGIVDIEFMVQFMVLAQASHCAQLARWSDNVRILEAAVRCDLITEQEIQQLTQYYLTLRSTLHEFALQHGETVAVGDEVAAAVMDPLKPLREGVTRLWDKVFSPYLLSESNQEPASHSESDS